MAQAVPQLEKFRYGGNFSRFLEQFEDYVALTGAMPRVDLLLLSLIDGITWDKIGRVRMEGPAGNDDPDHRAEVAAVKEFYREAYTRVEDRRSHQAKFTMLNPLVPGPSKNWHKIMPSYYSGHFHHSKPQYENRKSLPPLV